MGKAEPSSRRAFLLEILYENYPPTLKTWQHVRAARAYNLLKLLDYRARTGRFEAPWHSFANHGPESKAKSWQL